MRTWIELQNWRPELWAALVVAVSIVMIVLVSGSKTHHRR
jgi:hypothetical protein